MALPCTCRHCGSDRIRKLGEHTTETLERVPAHWKVITHVRETFTCRVCEKITETPSPSHPIARGRAGPQLLAEVLFAKYRAHLPLNRQSDIYAKEGVDLDVSTLAGWVAAAAATLTPLVDEIKKHVLGAERIHGDDTTVPVLAKANAQPAGCGPMCATIARSAAKQRLPRCSITPMTAEQNIPKTISPITAASCKPTPTPVITASTLKAVNQARSSKRPVGPMGGASSSNSPTYRKRPSLATSSSSCSSN